MQEFLELFDSEESVERDYLKNILHKLYAKVSTQKLKGKLEEDKSFFYRALNCSISTQFNTY